MATSQHRCVFVGNIPYDATEEQLIEICREVGPVVSFRLVIDRETGKPKGYGFCEYKDEETALSARRNLHGYEINGRQLRVDFAENDKGADRNREQGRGGPGLAANVEPQKQLGGIAGHSDSVIHQPIGLHLAISAASTMAAALGGAQVGVQSNQNGLQNQLALASDPLTLHLAKMSRNQLNDIMYELKQMATQNKEDTRQLLLSKPLLLKAIFQAQMMLGMVTPQVMPNLRQGPDHPAQTSLQDGQRQTAAQLPGPPPLAQKMQLMPKVQEGQVPAVTQHSLLHNQLSASLQPTTMHPQVQLPQHTKNQVLQQVALPGMSGAPTHPLGRPQVQVANSSSLNQQIQPPLENPAQVASASLGHNRWVNAPNAAMRPSILPRPDAFFQPGPAASSDIVQTFSKGADRSVRLPNDASWADRNNSYSNMHAGLAERTSMIHDSSEFINRPAKMLKVDGSSAVLPTLNPSKVTGTAPSQEFGVGMLTVNPVSKVEEVQNSEKQIPQLPLGVESALLQQVLSLTPEQLSSLPPEQREQVIQLQQALLRDQMQPS